MGEVCSWIAARPLYNDRIVGSSFTLKLHLKTKVQKLQFEVASMEHTVPFNTGRSMFLIAKQLLQAVTGTH